MQHKYIIIDESEKKEEKICGIGCVLIDSKEEIEKLKEKIESCKEELGFGELANKQGVPHYCEDSKSQQNTILKSLKTIGAKGYVIYKKYKAEEMPKNHEYYKNLLPIIIKGIIQKLNKKEKEMKVIICFEEGGYNTEKLREILKETINKTEYEIKTISKKDMNGATSLPDYTLGTVLNYITDKNRQKPRSLAREQLEIFSRFISLIVSINEEEKPVYYRITKEKHLQEFKKNAGKFS